jgi:hypothetical protein
MAHQPSCGEALVTLLESYGVDTVLTRHEQGAGFDHQRKHPPHYEAAGKGVKSNGSF